MSDPCGIVDTIQSNFNAIEYGVDTGAATTTTATPTKTKKETGGSEAMDHSTESKNGGELLSEEVAVDKNDDSGNADEEDTASKSNCNNNNETGLLRGWTTTAIGSPAKEEEKKEEQPPQEPPKMDPVSDLSDLSRKICVVTTAGLPWRTGTAVNPLARALYLTRGRPKHSVTLMIPWLETHEEQAKVYGSNVFETPEEQEAWTRKYSRERILNAQSGGEGSDATRGDTDASEDDEVDNLQIRFYPAKFHNLFGSIFATVDICALIPQGDADIAILEEPEHLTWFRSLPPSSKKSSAFGGSSAVASTSSAMSSMMDNDTSCGACAVQTTDSEEVNDNQANTKDDSNGSSDKNSGEDDQKRLEEMAIIGWTAKFRYVVGILHTNYSAYMRQYGLGASIVTASALQALSSVCVRAYTHRLIRLSDTLPELDKPKEITCNVHGVRSEFFVQNEATTETATETSEATEAPAESESKEEIGEEDEARTPQGKKLEVDTQTEATDDVQTKNTDTTEDDDAYNAIENDEEFEPEPVYFIGKVIWAKGFDKLLEIEDLYRRQTGDYFPIDVYGSGGDYDAISRAFLGRSGLAKRVISSDSVKSLDESRTTSRERSKSPDLEPYSPKDQTAALLFSKEGSLRGQIDDLQSIPSNELVVEVQTCETPVNVEVAGTPSSARNYPKQIITQLGEKTKETGTGVTKAIATLSEKISNLGFRSIYRETDTDSEDNNNTDEGGSVATGSSIASKFRFDPPKSRYELRRHSIPARFLGVKDHALLRDIPGHKVFVNLSITEVLCTTTAEAMAMGKFVVIPKHPSNTFFLQFPNCRAYESKKECVDHIKFALENEPMPLSPDDRHKLTWEGANLRLFESSLMTEAEAEERNKKTSDFARLHMDTMKTGAFFQGLWARGAIKNPLNPLMKEEKEKPAEKEATIVGMCKV